MPSAAKPSRLLARVGLGRVGGEHDRPAGLAGRPLGVGGAVAAGVGVGRGSRGRLGVSWPLASGSVAVGCQRGIGRERRRGRGAPGGGGGRGGAAGSAATCVGVVGELHDRDRDGDRRRARAIDAGDHERRAPAGSRDDARPDRGAAVQAPLLRSVIAAPQRGQRCPAGCSGAVGVGRRGLDAHGALAGRSGSPDGELGRVASSGAVPRLGAGSHRLSARRGRGRRRRLLGVLRSAPPARLVGASAASAGAAGRRLRGRARRAAGLAPARLARVRRRPRRRAGPGGSAPGSPAAGGCGIAAPGGAGRDGAGVARTAEPVGEPQCEQNRAALP